MYYSNLISKRDSLESSVDFTTKISHKRVKDRFSTTQNRAANCPRDSIFSPKNQANLESKAVFEGNMNLFKKYVSKMGYGLRLRLLGKFSESIDILNAVPKPLDMSHFTLVNTAICYMHLVQYPSAQKLFAYAFKREPFESYGLDFYR